MPINSIQKMKIFYSAWKIWHHPLQKMIIVKCNPKVHFKIYNLWIQVKKFFRKTKFKNSSFSSLFVFLYTSIFSFSSSTSFLLYMREKKNLMSEFLSVCVCVYIYKAKQQNQIAQVCAHFYSSFHVFFSFLFIT